MNTTYDTSANIRAELARQKITARELARRLDMTHSAVGRRLTGSVAWTVPELVQIAKVLDVPPATLIGDETAA